MQCLIHMPKLNQRGIVHLLIPLILFAGIIVGVYLIGKQTNLFPKAAEIKIAGGGTGEWIEGVSVAGYCNGTGNTNKFKCNLVDILKTGDNKNAGLAYENKLNGACRIGDYNVSSCADINLGGIYDISKVKVIYKFTDETLCGDSCEGTFCRTNPGGVVFSSRDNQAWIKVGTLNYSTALASATQIFDATASAKYIRVCRGGGGGHRSNLAVDYVSAYVSSIVPPSTTPHPPIIPSPTATASPSATLTTSPDF